MSNTTTAWLCALLPIVFGISGCDDSNIDPVYTLNYLSDNFEKTGSVSYDVIVYQKYFSKSDTVKFSGNVRLVKEQSDTVFGGYIHYATDKDVNRLYDLTNIFSLVPGMPPTSYEVAKGQTSAITSDMVNWYFLEPSRLRSLTTDSTVSLSVLPDTLLDGRACLTITVRYPDDEDFSGQEKRIFISRDVDEIFGYSYISTFQGEQQYDSVLFTNIVNDKVDAPAILKTRDSLLQAFQWTAYEEPDASYYQLLPDGTTAPDITGTDAVTGEKLSLSGFAGKVVILDFFYMSCMPCIKAIPKLSALQDKFKDRGLVVLGINSKDNNEERRSRLPGFMEKNNVNYRIILVDDAADKAYKIKVYPSMYIIGENGKILTSVLGLVDNMEESMSEYLEAHFRTKE